MKISKKRRNFDRGASDRLLKRRIGSGARQIPDDGPESVPSARFSHSATLWQERSMVIFGGIEQDSLVTLADMWLFDLRELRWTRMVQDIGWDDNDDDDDTTWPAPRYAHQAIARPNRMLLFGGFMNGSNELWQMVDDESCATHDNCEQCTLHESCGWCHSMHRCIAGSALQAYLANTCYSEHYSPRRPCVTARSVPPWAIVLCCFAVLSIVGLAVAELVRRHRRRIRQRQDQNQEQEHLYRIIE
jgi:hypothetical protein